MYRGALLAGLILAGLSPAGAQPSPQSPLALIAKHPITFYIARGEDDACGPGCNTWIAAEGNFDRDAPIRFRDFLKKTGTYKLPVFFHSPGGLSLHAQLIGRQMREHSMTAGVARTFPDACVGADEFACDALKASGETLRSEWSAVDAQCNSACVFALIGARERRVPLGSSLAVHAGRTTCLRGGTVMDPNLSWCRNMVAADKAKLLEYVRQMGIDPALIEFADDVPHDVLYTLSREEIVRFGIDRAEPGALFDNQQFEYEYKRVGQNAPWTDAPKFVAPRWTFHKEPLFLFVAEGPPNSCGAGCNRWIAAEGSFDRGAAEQLKKFLDGRPNLPIYFHSAGGSIAEAVEIGKHLRKLRAKAAVGRTALQQCVGQATSADCRNLVEKTAGHPAAQLRQNEGLCLSACAYALVGASTRTVENGARVAVHGMRFNRARLPELGVDPKMVTPELLKQANQNTRRHVHAYLSEMGADPELLEFAEKVSPDNLRVLSRSELLRFGVVSQAQYEMRWTERDAAPNVTYSIFKAISRRAPTDEQLTTILWLSCPRVEGITMLNAAAIQVQRERLQGEPKLGPRIRVKLDETEIWSSVSSDSSDPHRDLRTQIIPFDTISKITPRSTLELSESFGAGPLAGQTITTKLSIDGLAALLKKMHSRCEYSQAASPR